MSTQVVLDVPDEVYQQVQQVAKTTRQEVSEIIVERLAEMFTPPVTQPDRAAMLANIEAYKVFHPELVQTHLRQFVAIHDGQLIDHDADKEALFARMQANYAGEIVLQRQVLPDADPVLPRRSRS